LGQPSQVSNDISKHGGGADIARIFRKLDESSTCVDLRAERIFTIARVEDEAVAAEFATRFDGWVPRIAKLEQDELALAEEEQRVAAATVGANSALDELCTDLSEELLRQVARDDPRYRAFFKTTCTDFIRHEFDEQVKAMRNWVDTSSDAVFLARRDAIEKAVLRGERALKREAALATLRSNRDIARKELAESFTQDRDVLHDDLAKVARDGKLGRGWPTTFFKTGDRPRTKKDAPQPS